ncbi:hypothetical protein POTOM_003886 [Populus tomentosa]|uniref:Uncharacterized protein n=1 Tax=Populus tomentosa TaxID=118781 RepID=A0A8X8AJ85_POPTO|nr:hypothetical protein POTOM_003886 [Populus tomentosa]
MAVKSTKMSGACSLEKKREILSKLDGCPGVKQCYGEDVTLGEEEETVYNLLLNLLMMLLELILLTILSGGCGLPEPLNILMATAGVLAATNHVAKIGDFGTAKKANKKTSLRGMLKMLTAKPPWILKTDRKKDPDSVTRDLLSMIGSTHESPAIPDNISEEGEGEKHASEGKEVLDPEGVILALPFDVHCSASVPLFLIDLFSSYEYIVIIQVVLFVYSGNGRNLYILDALAEVEE